MISETEIIRQVREGLEHNQKQYTEIKNKASKVEEDVDNLEGKHLALKNHVDEISAHVRSLDDFQFNINKKNGKAPEQLLQKEIFGTEQFQSFLTRKTRDTTFEISRKAATDVLQSTNLTGDIAQRIPVVAPTEAIRLEHMRDIIGMSAATSNAVQWSEVDTSTENNVQTTAEGADKGKSDVDAVMKQAPVKKLSTYIRFSSEWLDDLAGLTQFISSRFVQQLLGLEDTQILQGDGLGTNLEGIMPVATDYTDSLADSAATQIDVIAMACQQLKGADYMRSTHIVMNSADVTAMALLKDTQDRFLVDSVYSGVPPTIMGIPILQTSAMPSGQVLVGDFARGCQLWQRDGISVRFFEQDADNVTTNKVTMVIEERLALAIYEPKAFIHISDLGAAVTAAGS